MKPNIIFLILGIILSIISKIYQFTIKGESYVGNIIVIPAAICFCLAVLFSLKRYNGMFLTNETRSKAAIVAVLACGTIVSFQLMMLSIVGNRVLYGILFLLLFLVFLILFVKNWV